MSAEPREPSTVENRVNTRCFVPFWPRNPALVHRCRVPVGLEHPVGGGAAGVHHPLRDALVVEVGDLLPEVEVLQQRRAAGAGLQRVVGVRQPQALRRGQELTGLSAGIHTAGSVVGRAGGADRIRCGLVGVTRGA